jgi:hypothetical protein
MANNYKGAPAQLPQASTLENPGWAYVGQTNNSPQPTVNPGWVYVGQPVNPVDPTHSTMSPGTGLQHTREGHEPLSGNATELATGSGATGGGL